MSPTSLNRNRGITLIELLVATAIFSLISVAAFKILVEGGKYVRLNQLAIDAQRSGLFLLSEIGSGLQATKPTLIDVGPEGVILASSNTPDGRAEFDPITGALLWQKWVCYYLDNEEVTRREILLTIPTSTPGPPPTFSDFNAIDPVKSLGREITNFQVTQIGASPPLWAIDVTVGSMTNAQRYGIELHSEVGPRN